MSESEPLDRFLLEELAKGNPRAFDQIFRYHFQNLSRFAFSIVHDRDTARNLVQQTFVNLWENRHSLDHVQRLTPYLTVTVKNNSLNWLKSESRNIRTGDFRKDRRNEDSTQEQVNLHDFEEQLINALATLPERCRTAFEMSRFENLGNREIALRMGISVKGVEALIGRSLKSLRIALADFLPESRNPGSGTQVLFFLVGRT